MGWNTQYTGPQIDEALEKGRNLRVVNNGWIRLDSSSTSPTNLGDLKNPGNYTTSFYSDGPSGKTGYNPLNVCIYKVNDIIYQVAEFDGINYMRNIAAGSQNYGSWTIQDSEGSTHPGPTAPTNPTDGKTLWLDTSDPENPVLKIYINGEWKIVSADGVMLASIYDTQNKGEDIFKYIDKAIDDASIGTAGIDFNEHINDDTIHVTAADKKKWNSAATQEDVNEAAAALQQTLQSTISSEVAENASAISTLQQTVTSLNSSLTTHTSNNTIHPNSSKQAEWDAKAEGDHTHNLDGKVTVDVDHVTETIPESLLPYEVKERVYEVDNIEAMYALTKNPYHNGDAIKVKDGGWFFIIDDTKLGTAESANAFKQVASGSSSLEWSAIQNKPTTIEGYGITDAATQEDVQQLEEALAGIDTSQLPTAEDYSNITTLQSKYNEALNTIELINTAFGNLDTLLTKLENVAN